MIEVSRSLVAIPDSPNVSQLTREHAGDEVDWALGHPAGGEVAEESVEALVGLQQVQQAQLVLHAVVLDLVVDHVALPVVATPAPPAPAAPTVMAPPVMARSHFSYLMSSLGVADAAN